MRLAVSNIAWSDADESAVLTLLRQRGITGIEVAPTRLWPEWAGATPPAARAMRKRLAGEGFEVPSLQAIFFAKPELNLFGDDGAFVDHVRHVADLAVAFGARILVFGAPKNRDRGTLSPETAFERAVATLRRIGADCAACGIKLCIEPNPPAYGCNFVTDSREGMALVRAVDSPGFGLHLDTAGMRLANEDATRAIVDTREQLAHFHISEPHLAPIVPASIDHEGVARALRRIGHAGWVAIEMRRPADPVASLARSVDHVRHCYRGRLRIAAPDTASIEAVA